MNTWYRKFASPDIRRARRWFLMWLSASPDESCGCVTHRWWIKVRLIQRIEQCSAVQMDAGFACVICLMGAQSAFKAPKFGTIGYDAVNVNCLISLVGRFKIGGTRMAFFFLWCLPLLMI